MGFTDPKGSQLLLRPRDDTGVIAPEIVYFTRCRYNSRSSLQIGLSSLMLSLICSHFMSSYKHKIACFRIYSFFLSVAILALAASILSVSISSIIISLRSTFSQSLGELSTFL